MFIFDSAFSLVQFPDATQKNYYIHYYFDKTFSSDSAETYGLKTLETSEIYNKKLLLFLLFL